MSSYLQGFCHYPHKGVDAEQHGCTTKDYKSTDSPLTPLVNHVMYCVRVSLRTVKYSLRNTKEKGAVGNLYISLVFPRLYYKWYLSPDRAGRGSEVQMPQSRPYIQRRLCLWLQYHLLHSDQSQINFLFFYLSCVAYIPAWMQSIVNTQVVNLNYACVR